MARPLSNELKEALTKTISIFDKEFQYRFASLTIDCQYSGNIEYRIEIASRIATINLTLLHESQAYSFFVDKFGPPQEAARQLGISAIEDNRNIEELIKLSGCRYEITQENIFPEWTTQLYPAITPQTMAKSIAAKSIRNRLETINWFEQPKLKPLPKQKSKGKRRIVIQ